MEWGFASDRNMKVTTAVSYEVHFSYGVPITSQFRILCTSEKMGKTSAKIRSGAARIRWQMEAMYWALILWMHPPSALRRKTFHVVQQGDMIRTSRFSSVTGTAVGHQRGRTCLPEEKYHLLPPIDQGDMHKNTPPVHFGSHEKMRSNAGGGVRSITEAAGVAHMVGRTDR